MFKIGDKVIPISKSTGASYCQFWKQLKEGHLNFLYVVGKNEQHYTLNSRSNSATGNYYLEKDLISFEVDENELFSKFVRGEINKKHYERLLKHTKRGD